MDNTLDPEDLLGKKLPYAGGLRLESILGYGSFATVYKAKNKEGQVYAVKWLNKIGMSDRDKALQKDEVMYMKLLGEHKNIIRLYDVIETSDSLYLIMECCTTDLYELITQSEKAIEIPRVKRYFNEICDGVKHCHNNHIYHRDLKPENILISDDDHCKISDFGLCCFDEWTNDFNCGSLRYMSPECIDNEEDDDDYDDDDDFDDDNYYNGGDRKRKNEKTGLECNSRGSDVWALGVILINMIFGQNPWSSADMENPTFNMFIRKDPDVLQRKLGLSDEFNRVVKRMFSKNVFDRYSLDELRQEVNRIEVFTDFNKRVSNYLGIDEELINMSNMAIESSSKNEDENNSQYDEWYDDDDTYFNQHHDHDLVVPDIDTLELGNEENKDKQNDDHDHNQDHSYSFDYMNSYVPFISHWGDDIDDDEDMASELTPRVAEDEDENGEKEKEKEKYSTSKLTISTMNPSLNDEMSWENTNENMNSKEWSQSTKINSLETNEKMNIYDYTYENKMKEWKKEEEEDQMESDDNLMTPTVERVLSFNKGKLFDVNSTGKQSLSKKKSVQLRWEDLFDSDEEKKETKSSQRNEASSPSSNGGDGEGRFHISEQALPSSWNYQQGLSWGDMMDDDDDDFMPSKPQEETILNKSKTTSITTAFIEDSNEEDNVEEVDKEEKKRREEERDEHEVGRELSFKKEKVPISSEVSTLVTPSLLTNGMQKKLLFAAAKKSRKQDKEKKSSGKNKYKGIKEKDKDKDNSITKEKDKEMRRHHKSKREKEEGIGAIKIKTNGKHKHHHKTTTTTTTTTSLNEKSIGKEKKGDKSSMKHHRKNKNNKESLNSIHIHSSFELNTINHSEEKLSKIIKNNKNKNNKNNNKIHKHHKNEHNQKSLAVKSNNAKSNIDNTTKIHKINSINTTSTIITTNKPASVQLDWEDLFSSDGEERTLTTADSIKTNDKSFSIDETLEAEDEIFSLTSNIKALNIENEKNHKDSTTVNKMVDSAISVSETNLSKEIKNLNLH